MRGFAGWPTMGAASVATHADGVALQMQLRDLGYNLGGGGPNDDGVDGIVGPITVRAATAAIRELRAKVTNVPNTIIPGFSAPAVVVPSEPGDAPAADTGTNPLWYVAGAVVVGGGIYYATKKHKARRAARARA